MTYCLIYLNPELYLNYNLKNTIGYSYETRLIILKFCANGNTKDEKILLIYNLARMRESAF